MAEQYTELEKKEILKILNKDRGKCSYCGQKLSMFDALATGNVCEKCVRRNHREAMGIYK
jgi:predicted amidophosphoribosyltransferase